MLLAAVAVVSTVLGVTSGAAQSDANGTSRVLVTEIDTEITPVIADVVADRISDAESGGYGAFVIELDTPGGLASSMRDIVEHILGSDIPVMVYVAPQGARAASAGAIIALASHVAVMAPGTTIGAATPVGLGGGDLSDKVVNDAASQAVSLAELRGRNVAVAEEMVRVGRSLDVTAALEADVVDARADSLSDALEAAHGRDVQVSGGTVVTVNTAASTVERADLGTLEKVKQWLVNPNLTFVLLLLAALGLIYELSSPGVGVAGIVGGASLVLALFSMALLPLEIVGILMLVGAIGLFAAELFAPGIGVFAVGGAVLGGLAALFLFDDAEGVEVDLVVMLPALAVTTALVVLAGRLVERSRLPPTTGTGLGSLVGRTVTVQDVTGSSGRAFIEGSWWNIRMSGSSLRAGERSHVVDQDGLTLIVEPSHDRTEHNEPNGKAP